MELELVNSRLHGGKLLPPGATSAHTQAPRPLKKPAKKKAKAKAKATSTTHRNVPRGIEEDSAAQATCDHEGQEYAAAPAAPTTPKRQGERADETEPEYQGDDVETDVLEGDSLEKCPAYLTIENGHGSSVCIFLRLSCRDKSQILQVTPNHTAGKAITPVQVVETVATKLKDLIDALPMFESVKKAPPETMSLVRAEARRLRQEVLEQ